MLRGYRYKERERGRGRIGIHNCVAKEKQNVDFYSANRDE